MELTARQQETIDNLKIKGITKPQDIIAYCTAKLNLPVWSSLGKKNRRHSKKYYQGIIDYLAQQPLKQTNNEPTTKNIIDSPARDL